MSEVAIDVDRIRALAEDESVDLPPITAEQAIAVRRLLDTPLARAHPYDRED